MPAVGIRLVEDHLDRPPRRPAADGAHEGSARADVFQRARNRR